MQRPQLTVLGFLCSIGFPPVAAQEAVSRPITFEPHVLALSDGKAMEAELGYLAVPERRSGGDAKTIELAVIRLRSTSDRPGTPVLYLNGDPGGTPASQVVQNAALYAAFESLRRAGDVLVLDYRGTGLSRPRLVCPTLPSPALDTFASREQMLRLFLQVAERCSSHLREQGVDIRGYTWEEVADDVAATVDALRLPRIRLVGFSSGTHAALATIRRHGSRIESAVLVGTEGMDHTRKLPSNIDRHLARIADLLRSDPGMRERIPDLLALIRTVLARLERKPAEVSVELPTGEQVTMPVGRFALEFITSKSLSGPDEFAILPRLYHALSQGDASPLGAVMQRVVNRPPPSPLAYVMDGAAGASPERWDRIRCEAQQSMLGNAVNFPFPEVRSAWGYEDLGHAYRETVRASVPILFITGELDGNTPPHQAEEVRAGFPRSQHLVIENGGHGSAFMSVAAIGAMLEYLRDGTVPEEKIGLTPPRFLPIER